MQYFSGFAVHFHHFKIKSSPLYLLGFMLLFWTLFDGILTYIIPLIITQHSYSKTFMGFVIGSSSIFGALFDIFAFKLLPTTNFRRIFMIMFGFCLIYPFILLNASTLVIYLFAMCVWGIYYDLKNFGCLDFISRHTKKSDHSTSFGVVQSFQSVGYLLAPLITGILVAEVVDWKPFAFALGFLLISFLFFFELVGEKPIQESTKELERASRLTEKSFPKLKLLFSLDRIMFPILILTLVLFVIESSFWTIGPLFAESFSENKIFAGFLISAYTLPYLLVGWVVGKLTSKYGKRRVAYVSLLIGSSVLSLLVLGENNLILSVTLIFISSIFISMSFPAINGVYADLITEKVGLEKEIESLSDFYTNLGYVIGPMCAGFIADRLGNAGTFTIIGIIGMIVAVILINISPKNINLRSQIINN